MCIRDRVDPNNVIINAATGKVMGERGGYWGCDHWDLVQWTGLTDMNDVDIYEGDCLHNDDSEYSAGVIKWSHKYNGWVMDDDYEIIGSDDLSDAIKTHSAMPNPHKVIGNIYENPELLGK